LKEARSFEVCRKRSDYQSEQVSVRMAGVLTNLHAADVRYHVDCKATFMSPKSVKASSRQSSTRINSDQPLDTASGTKTTIHNAVD